MGRDDPSADLAQDALVAVLPGRPLRSYAALVSTGSAALGWAARGAPEGAVVVAREQLSARGHAGRPLTHGAGRGLAFSVVMRPALPIAREGWLYSVVLIALADVLGEEATVAWPDEVRLGDAMAAAVGIHTRAGGQGILWAVAEVLLPQARSPRGPVLRRALEAITARATARSETVLRDLDGVCETIGRHVRARMRAGTAPSIEGRAVATAEDGAIVLETAGGERVAVRPQDVRRVERL